MILSGINRINVNPNISLGDYDLEANIVDLDLRVEKDKPGNETGILSSTSAFRYF